MKEETKIVFKIREETKEVLYIFHKKNSSCTFGQWSMQFLTSTWCHFLLWSFCSFPIGNGNRLMYENTSWTKWHLIAQTFIKSIALLDKKSAKIFTLLNIAVIYVNFSMWILHCWILQLLWRTLYLWWNDFFQLFPLI